MEHQSIVVSIVVSLLDKNPRYSGTDYSRKSRMIIIINRQKACAKSLLTKSPHGGTDYSAVPS